MMESVRGALIPKRGTAWTISTEKMESNVTKCEMKERPMSALAHDTLAGAPQPLAEELSRFAPGLTYEQIPAVVRDRAKHLILDSVGIALASTK